MLSLKPVFGTTPPQVLDAYTASFDFHDLRFDAAIRLFLESFRLPGEAQKIDRIINSFGNHFYAANPGIFKCVRGPTRTHTHTPHAPGCVGVQRCAGVWDVVARWCGGGGGGHLQVRTWGRGGCSAARRPRAPWALCASVGRLAATRVCGVSAQQCAPL